MPFITIDDPADARLAPYRNVPDAALLRQGGLFVAEGRLVVARLLADRRFATQSVLVTEAARQALDEVLGARPEVPVFVVAPWVINAITGFNIHRGCLAIGERGLPAAWPAVAAQATRLVILERVANADNVGSIFRHAAAFAAGGVLLDATCTDPLYRKAIRTSMAATLRVPFARMAPWPGALRELRAGGWSLVALTPGGDATIRDVASGSGPPTAPSGFSRIAILLGHEGGGLTPEALALCDIRARIPMAPDVDSLNVATAAAIAMYELF